MQGISWGGNHAATSLRGGASRQGLPLDAAQLALSLRPSTTTPSAAAVLQPRNVGGGAVEATGEVRQQPSLSPGEERATAIRQLKLQVFGISAGLDEAAGLIRAESGSGSVGASGSSGSGDGGNGSEDRIITADVASAAHYQEDAVGQVSLVPPG